MCGCLGLSMYPAQQLALWDPPIFPSRCAQVCVSVCEKQKCFSHGLLTVTVESRLWGTPGCQEHPPPSYRLAAFHYDANILFPRRFLYFLDWFTAFSTWSWSLTDSSKIGISLDWKASCRIETKLNTLWALSKEISVVSGLVGRREKTQLSKNGSPQKKTTTQQTASHKLYWSSAAEKQRQGWTGGPLPSLLTILPGPDWPGWNAPSCSQSLVRSRPPHPGQQVSWIKPQSAQGGWPSDKSNPKNSKKQDKCSFTGEFGETVETKCCG